MFSDMDQKVFATALPKRDIDKPLPANFLDHLCHYWPFFIDLSVLTMQLARADVNQYLIASQWRKREPGTRKGHSA
jgi:hypothetical protein